MNDQRGYPPQPKGGGSMFIRVLAVLLALVSLEALAGREIEGLAIVRSDGSLLIQEQVVRLHGIYLPPTERQCREWIKPVRCDSRAVLALDFRVKGDHAYKVEFKVPCKFLKFFAVGIRNLVCNNVYSANIRIQFIHKFMNPFGSPETPA